MMPPFGSNIGEPQACILGAWYNEGAHGLPQDKAQAAYWYDRLASATYNHIRPTARESCGPGECLTAV